MKQLSVNLSVGKLFFVDGLSPLCTEFIWALKNSPLEMHLDLSFTGVDNERFC